MALANNKYFVMILVLEKICIIHICVFTGLFDFRGFLQLGKRPRFSEICVTEIRLHNASTVPHWPILDWNVSKSWLQKVDFFQNCAIVAMQSDNITFYACKILKCMHQFEENTFFHQLAPTSKKTGEIFFKYK